MEQHWWEPAGEAPAEAQHARATTQSRAHEAQRQKALSAEGRPEGAATTGAHATGATQHARARTVTWAPGTRGGAGGRAAGTPPAGPTDLHRRQAAALLASRAERMGLAGTLSAERPDEWQNDAPTLEARACVEALRASFRAR
eukprot:2763324-Pleurochrysis_carterae.AAC.1